MTSYSRRTSLFFIALITAGLTGCFDPEFGEGGFHCTPSEGPDACPEGYRCTQFGEDGNFLCRTTDDFDPQVSVALTKTEVKMGEPVKMDITVQNFTLNGGAIGGAPVAGEGHVHIFFAATPNEWEVTTATEVEIDLTAGLKPGDHKVVVQLFENNHQPVTPVVRAEASFTLVP